jgi:hypothetical protein
MRRRVHAGIAVFGAGVAALLIYRGFQDPYKSYDEYRRLRRERAGESVVRLEPEAATARLGDPRPPTESEIFRRKQTAMARELRDLDRALLDKRYGPAEKLATAILEKLLTDDDCLTAACLIKEMPEYSVIEGLLAVILHRAEAAEAAAVLKERLVAAAMYSKDKDVARRALEILQLPADMAGVESSRPAFQWGDLRDAGLAHDALRQILDGAGDERAMDLLQLLRNVPPALRDEVQREVLIPVLEAYARLDEEQPLWGEYSLGGKYLDARVSDVAAFVLQKGSGYDVEAIYAGLSNPRARMELWWGLPFKEPYLSEWRAEAGRLVTEGPYRRTVIEGSGRDLPYFALARLLEADRLDEASAIVRPYHAMLSDEPRPNGTGAPVLEWNLRWNPVILTLKFSELSQTRDHPEVIAFLEEMRTCGHAPCRQAVETLDRIRASRNAGEDP